jgi:hypothetical protein
LYDETIQYKPARAIDHQFLVERMIADAVATRVTHELGI